MKLGDIDAPMILRYVAQRRAEGKAANTINADLATPILQHSGEH